MDPRRRRIAKIGATLFGGSFVLFFAMFLGWFPSSGLEAGLLIMIGFPLTILGTVGFWLLIWTAFFWKSAAPAQKAVS
jgi:hypothetical protein